MGCGAMCVRLRGFCESEVWRGQGREVLKWLLDGDSWEEATARLMTAGVLCRAAVGAVGQ